MTKENKLLKEYSLQRMKWLNASDNYNPKRASPSKAIREWHKLKKIEDKLRSIGR